MKGTLLVVLIVTVTAAALPVRAHHSFAATYDESKTATIEG